MLEKINIRIMGCSQTGKTAMRVAVFHGRRDFTVLAPTQYPWFSSYSYLSNVIHTIDLPDNTVEILEMGKTRRRNFFENVDVVMFMFDCTKKERAEDLSHYFDSVCLTLMHSPNAKIFVFNNKVDLLPKHMIDKNLRKLKTDVQKVNKMLTWYDEIWLTMKMKYFSTSVHDYTPFKAWSELLTRVNPMPNLLKDAMRDLCNHMEVDRIYLYDTGYHVLIASINIGAEVDKDEPYQWMSLLSDRILEEAEIKPQTINVFYRRFMPKTSILAIYSNVSLNNLYLKRQCDSGKKFFAKFKGILY